LLWSRLSETSWDTVDYAIFLLILFLFISLYIFLSHEGMTDWRHFFGSFFLNFTVLFCAGTFIQIGKVQLILGIAYMGLVSRRERTWADVGNWSCFYISLIYPLFRLFSFWGLFYYLHYFFSSSYLWILGRRTQTTD